MSTKITRIQEQNCKTAKLQKLQNCKTAKTQERIYQLKCTE